MGATIEQAIEDYKYGFYTTHDADSGDIYLGFNCIDCGREFFQKRIDGMRLAGLRCDGCIMEFEKFKKFVDCY